jgi:hypothetical protein
MLPEFPRQQKFIRLHAIMSHYQLDWSVTGPVVLDGGGGLTVTVTGAGSQTFSPAPTGIAVCRSERGAVLPRL